MAHVMGRNLMELSHGQARYIRAYKQFTRRRHGGALPIWWDRNIWDYQAARVANLHAFANAIDKANVAARLGRKAAMGGTV